MLVAAPEGLAKGDEQVGHGQHEAVVVLLVALGGQEGEQMAAFALYEHLPSSFLQFHFQKIGIHGLSSVHSLLVMPDSSGVDRLPHVY